MVSVRVRRMHARPVAFPDAWLEFDFHRIMLINGEERNVASRRDAARKRNEIGNGRRNWISFRRTMRCEKKGDESCSIRNYSHIVNNWAAICV